MTHFVREYSSGVKYQRCRHLGRHIRRFFSGAVPPKISQRDTNFGEFSFCIGSCLQLRCIRASCNSSQLSTVPADCADLAFRLFQENRVRDSNQMPTLRRPFPATRPTRIRPSNNTKTVVNMGSQWCLSLHQRTSSKFVCLKYCGNRGNSNVSQKERQKCLQLRKFFSKD